MLKRIARQITAMTVCVTFTLSASFAQTVTYFHNDPGGTPQMATDSSGAVVWKETYKPYGEKVLNSANSASNALWFAGKPYDSNTGLSYFGARYYDPTVGRFIGVDPKAPDAQNLYSFNRFAYGNDNPYRYVDPDGQFAIAIEALVVLAAFTAALYVSTVNVLPKQRQDADHPALNWSIFNGFKSESSDSAPPPANGKNVSSGGTAKGVSASGAPIDPDDHDKDDKNKGPNDSKQLKKLSNGEIKNLKDAGENPHDIKGKGASRYDLYKDKEGNVYQVLKGGRGEPQSTGININKLNNPS